MPYQLSHREFGVYQGNCLGLGFWYPLSEMPEQGICAFPTRQDAEDHRAFLCSARCDDPLAAVDLRVEPFDAATHEALLVAGGASVNATPES